MPQSKKGSRKTMGKGTTTKKEENHQPTCGRAAQQSQTVSLAAKAVVFGRLKEPASSVTSRWSCTAGSGCTFSVKVSSSNGLG